MLGGGNPVGGSNPAGVGSSINYIGEFAYAYSGGFGASTSPITGLDFTTGAEYLVGQLTLSLAVQDSAASNSAAFSNVDLNGELICNMQAGFAGADSVPSNTIDVIIPPFSRLQANLYSDENQSNRKLTLMFTGRVYA